jgi:hypothetical protein
MRIRSLLFVILLASGCASQPTSIQEAIEQALGGKYEEQQRIEYQLALDAQVGEERHDVVMREAELEVPNHVWLNDEFMRDNFGSMSLHTNFTSITSARWALKWCVFSACLVEKAKAQDLDGDSLARCLSTIAPKVDRNTAYVPYAACHVHDPHTGSNYWAITSVWEYNFPDPMQLGHIRMWLVNSSNLTVVGEASCD